MKQPQTKKPSALKAHSHSQNGAHAKAHDDDCGCGHDHGGTGEFEVGIRLYKPEDYRELKAIWKAGEIVTDETDSAKALKESTEKRKNSFRIFVAEVREIDPKNGKTTGVSRLAGGVIVAFDGHRVNVYHFAVHPDFRGVGLGGALMETCEHQAKLWGAKHLRLMSRMDPAREGARRLYEKRGWSADKNLCQYKKEL